MTKSASHRVRQQYVLDDKAVRRFWGKVIKDGPVPAGHPGLGPCWQWRSSSIGRGYSQFHIKLTDGRWSSTVAHRVAYELVIGEIPDGKILDHLCRNRPCVNPRHLEPVTDPVNILRGNGWAGRNSRVTHCPQGHAYSEANTFTDKRGQRHCRACDRERHQAARDRAKAAIM